MIEKQKKDMFFSQMVMFHGVFHPISGSEKLVLNPTLVTVSHKPSRNEAITEEQWFQ